MHCQWPPLERNAGYIEPGNTEMETTFGDYLRLHCHVDRKLRI
jgi:hypothetical protein